MNNYSGLTIILSEPGRHDNNELISGWSGSYFWNILTPLHRYNVDIRLCSSETALNPFTKVVLLLGQKSLDLLGTDERLEIVHGYPIIHKGITYIPTFHPQDAFDRRNYNADSEEEENSSSELDEVSVKTGGRTQRRNYRFWLYYDVKKAIRILLQGLTIYEYFEPVIHPKANQITTVLTNVKNTQLYVDIETDKNLNLTCIGFTFPNTPTFVIPWKQYTNTIAYTPNECYQIIRSLSIAFRDNIVVAHNSLFDLFVLAFRYHISFPTKIFDTMLAWSRIEPEVEKSLARVLSRFSDVYYHKSEGVYDPHNHAEQESLYRYNAKDVESLRIIYPRLIEEGVKTNTTSSIEQVNNTIPSTLIMMLLGIRINVEKLVELYEGFHKRAVQFERCLCIITGLPEFNPRSPKQVEQYLYGDLRLEKPEKDVTNEKQLLKLLCKREIPSIKLILAARKEGKASSDLKFRTWTYTGIDRKTTGYRLDSDTFRSRSKALLKFPPEKGYGGNLQNIDKEKIGEIFIPDEGKIFLKVDQSGADALIVAYLCRNASYRSLFLNGIKPHTYMAMRLFAPYWKQLLGPINIDKYLECSIDKLRLMPRWKELEASIKSDNIKYYVGKKTIHSASYGVKGPTLQMSILLDTNGEFSPSLKECNYWLGTFHDTFPEIQEWHLEIQNDLLKKRMLKNLFGYPRQFHQPPGEDLYKSGYAFIPQSTVAIITHLCITKLQRHIEEYNLEIDILQNEHDGVLIQCKNDRVNIDDCASLLKATMNQELTNFKGEKFSMRSEVSIGMNLKDMEELI